MKPIRLYACGTVPWEFDESNIGPLEFYCSADACYDDQECTDTCGILEFEVSQIGIARECKTTIGRSSAEVAVRQGKYLPVADKLFALARELTSDPELQRSAFVWALARLKKEARERRRAMRESKGERTKGNE